MNCHRVVFSKRATFNIFVRLPEDTLCRLKNLEDGSTVDHMKGQLELITGLPANTYNLTQPDGKELLPQHVLTLSNNVIDGSILRVKLHHNCSDLYTAIRNRNLDWLSYLHHRNQCVKSSEPSEIMFFALFMACFYGRLDVCRYAVSVSGCLVNAKTEFGNSPLHVAASQDRVLVAMFLCEQGASLTDKNNFEETPGDCAARFGAITCERKIRFSQWAQKKKLLSVDKTETLVQSDKTEYNLSTNHSETADGSTTEVSLNSDQISVSVHEETTLGPLAQQPEPQICHEKLKIKVSGDVKVKRSRSTPLPVARNTESRGTIIKANSLKSAKNLHCENKQEALKKSFLKMSRPQYLQYIKRASGIVEEDIFAELYPDVTEPKKKRNYHDQMERNQRLFKRLTHGDHQSDDDFDSSDEEQRKQENEKAFAKWLAKKISLEERAADKKSIVQACDVAGQNKAPELSDQNLSAFRSWSRNRRVKESSHELKKATSIIVEPATYEEWMTMKQETIQQKISVTESPSKVSKDLKKKIDYQTWLDSVKKRTSKAVKYQRKEVKERHEFNQWLHKIKQEAKTYEIWSQKKDEQMERERARTANYRKNQQKLADKAKREKAIASKEAYEHWLSKREAEKIEKEEKLLQQELEKKLQLKEMHLSKYSN